MKSISIKTNSDWVPLNFKHEHDDLISFDSTKILTSDGLKLTTSKLQQNITDLSTDSYSNIALTDELKIDDVLNFNLNSENFPVKFTTSLICNAYPTFTNISAYIAIEELLSKSDSRVYYIGDNPGRDSWFYAQTEEANEIYFNITIYDDNNISVSHIDTMDRVFMSVVEDDLSIVFKVVADDIPTDAEFFNYYINNDNGFLILYKVINSDVYWLVPDIVAGKIKLLPATDVPGAPLPLTTAMRYTPYRKTVNDMNLPNNWVTYQTSDNQNNLDVNITDSITDVSNNYLLDSQFYNIDNNGDVLVNITQLKNQISPDGDVNDQNPFPDGEPCKHREYNKMFFKDSDNLYLGYDTFEHEINIPPDSITYFNTPQNMYPYEQININDAGLIEKGAIGGDTPLHADKIFKKTSGYKYNSPGGQTVDEDVGTWLCSWLRSTPTTPWNENMMFNENIFVSWRDKIYRAITPNQDKQPNLFSEFWREENVPGPVWVDRYYNPEKFTVSQALEISGQYSTYRSKFDNVVDRLDAHDSYIFDKTSDLVFEPGGLYAYYRVGKSHIESLIDGLMEDSIHSGEVPAYYQDRTEFIKDDNNDYLTFTGDQYIETNTPANVTNSDFTITFDMSFDDWSKPIGSQILGNYTNEGVGIFNKIECTPYITLFGDDNIKLYNTDMVEVMSFDVEDTVSHTRLAGNENITIYKDISATVFDTKGLLVENLQLTSTISYRNEQQEVYITSSTPGVPNGIVRLYSSSYSSKHIGEIIEEWNDENPEFQLILTGQGSVYHYDSNGDVISSPWVPEQDIILLASDLEQSPAGKIVDADIDENYRYILDEHDQIFRFRIDNEQLDQLNTIFPFEPIGIGNTKISNDFDVVLETSGRKYLQTANDGEYQYIIDCESYTIDMFDQPWYVKGDVVYKFTLSEQDGINASFEDFIPIVGQQSSRYIMLVANNRDNGELGNIITIIPDGVKTLSTLVNEWNNVNLSNVVSIVEGDPAYIPDSKNEDGSDFNIQLTGGVNRGDTTTTIAFSSQPGMPIHGIKCNTHNEVFIVHGNKITKTLHSRSVIESIDLSTIEPTLSSGDFDSVAFDLVNEFDQDHEFTTYIILLIRRENTPEVNYIKLDRDLMVLSSNTIELPIEYNLSTQKSLTNFETIRQICKDVLNQNCIIFKTRLSSYFDTDKTSVKKMIINVEDFSTGFHNFSFSFNSNNSNISLFVDGILRVAESSDDTASGAAYKFSKTIQDPILVGAEPYFNNITFSEHIHKQNYMFVKNMKIMNYNVFNSYLNFNDIKSISKMNKKIEPLRFTLPCGKRDYLDHITSFYKHKTPGKKSTAYDITIVNDTLTGTSIQNYINNQLTDKINNLSPVNSYMKRINWIS